MRDDAADAGARPAPMAETDAPPTDTTDASTAPADKEEAVPRYVVLLAMCAALNSCNLGYDIGVNSGVGPHLQAKGEGMNLSDLQLELFFGIFGLAAMLGAAVAYTASDGLGRRKAFACTSVTFIIGVLWTATATSYPSLMMGRFVTGLGVGLGLAIDPVYIAEVSPPKHRGRLVTWSETATNVGILLGFVSGFAFRDAGEAGWRSMLALGAIIPSVLLVLVFTFMPVRARRPSLRGAALAVPSRRWRRVPPISPRRRFRAPLTRRWRLDWRRRDAIDATHHQRSHDPHDAPAPRAGVAALASS